MRIESGGRKSGERVTISPERAEYISEGCSPSDESERTKSKEQRKNDKYSPERAQYISEGCSPSDESEECKISVRSK